MKTVSNDRCVYRGIAYCRDVFEDGSMSSGETSKAFIDAHLDKPNLPSYVPTERSEIDQAAYDAEMPVNEYIRLMERCREIRSERDG